MKKIPLTQGKFALVDDADYDELSINKWCALRSGCKFYAVRITSSGSGARTSVRMHREVMGSAAVECMVDHINHDGLDNRRSNLRVVTNSQNGMNRSGAQGNSKTGVRGVSPRRAGYRAKITVGGNTLYLGDTFSTVAKASAAYTAANKKHFGQHGGRL